MLDIDKEMAPFPHCDFRVCHNPQDKCVYCDAYPELQQRRILEGVNFTGGRDPNKLQCPSEARRPLDIINRWHGNVPVTQANLEKSDAYFAQAERRDCVAFRCVNRSGSVKSQCMCAFQSALTCAVVSSE